MAASLSTNLPAQACCCLVNAAHPAEPVSLQRRWRRQKRSGLLQAGLGTSRCLRLSLQAGRPPAASPQARHLSLAAQYAPQKCAAAERLLLHWSKFLSMQTARCAKQRSTEVAASLSTNLPAQACCCLVNAAHPAEPVSLQRRWRRQKRSGLLQAGLGTSRCLRLSLQAGRPLAAPPQARHPSLAAQCAPQRCAAAERLLLYWSKCLSMEKPRWAKLRGNHSQCSALPLCTYHQLHARHVIQCRNSRSAAPQVPAAFWDATRG